MAMVKEVTKIKKKALIDELKELEELETKLSNI